MPETIITITFGGRNYEVVSEHTVTPLLAADGLKRQCVVEGVRGATYLYQVWAVQVAGVMRDVAKLQSGSARCKTEFVN